MRSALISEDLPRRISSFDELVKRFSETSTSFSEEQALKASHWDMGEDARLREDVRFRKTPGGRWILSSSLIANDACYEKLVRELRPELKLTEALAELSSAVGRQCVFCSADDRFVLQDDKLRLSAKQLTNRPLIEHSVLDIQKFSTHLPVHSLKAAAASEPAGEWGPNTQEQHIETLGWVRVNAPGRRKFNERMFVAQVEGHSMNDGRSGLVNGGYAIFELWPEGTRQNMSVLVRASFSDPETGSYAVKKYVGDIRDEEGRHHEIRLVSLNPDKARYPDIIVNEDNDVTVVAKVIQPLGPEDFAREPKRPRRPGHRNLRDPEQIEDLETRLRKLSERYFNDSVESSAEEPELTESDWKARLVCLGIESGALCIETRPIPGLPSFAKKLSVASGDDQRIVIASNLKFRTCRTPVAPSTESYTWAAFPPNDLVDEDLCAYAVDGLLPERCTIFKVDASDTGQLMTGNTITCGNTYRILVPPAIPLGECGFGTLHDVERGWKVMELTVPATPAPELQDFLSKLGYTIGQVEPIAKWIMSSPMKYEESPRGETYPVFLKSQLPVLSISGVLCSMPGDLMLLVVGDSNFQTLALQPGSQFAVTLNDLIPGRYMLQVVHERTKFSTLSIPFAVSADDVVFEDQMDLTVQLQGENIPMENGEINVDIDLLKDEGADRNSLQVTVPPCWTFKICGDDGHRRKLLDLVAETDGSVCLDGLWEAIQDQLQRCSTAVFSLDAGEFGVIYIRHTHRSKIDALRETLSSLLSAREGSFSEISGRFPLLRNLWLHPVFEKLGYDWQELSDSNSFEFPDGTTACLLTIPSIDDSCRVKKHPWSVVVMTSSQLQWDSTDNTSVRHFADSLCKHYKLNEAFLTDGTRWAKHRKNAKLKLKVVDFPYTLKSDDESLFEDFIREFANPGAVEG